MNIAEEIKQVEGLRGTALREKFREVTGLESRSNNRPYLIRRIVHALQVRAEGVSSATTAEALAALAAATARAATPPAGDAAPSRARKAAFKKSVPAVRTKRERDPRLPPPGTVLEREHDGKTIRVKVLEDGFEFRAKTYRSLSAIAREVTNVSWNGWLFFKLIPYAKREKQAA